MLRAAGGEHRHAVRNGRVTRRDQVLAENEDMPIEDILLGIFTDEVQRRQSASAARRADAAGLEPDIVFERWDKTAKVSFGRRVLQEAQCLRFIEARRIVVILGPVGVGKTFVASALAHVALPLRLQRALPSSR